MKSGRGGTAGCYPNQLQSITIQDKYAYVSSICASPKGPVGVIATATPPDVSNVKTTTHGVVSVIDLTTDKELVGSTSSLMAKFNDEYTKRTLPDDGTRRYAGVPADIGFVKGGGVGYVAANAADSVFRVRYDLAQASTVAEVGSQRAAKVEQLIQFILSIDSEAQATTIPTAGAQGGDFCSPLRTP